MLNNNNMLVLTDLGSVAEALLTVTSRKQAIAVQEHAAVQCTSSYRAPELFEVQFVPTFNNFVTTMPPYN